MNKPIFSIIVPFFNPGSLINHCIDSLNNLVFKEFEVIFVDDGTTEHLTEVYDCIKNKCLFNYRIIRQENFGLGVARNTGMSASNGDWILFLDCDDAISPTSLSEYFEVISVCPDDVSLICPKYKLVDKENIQTFECSDTGNRFAVLSGIDGSKKFLRRTLIILAPGTLYNLEFLKSNNLYFDKIRWSEDQLFIWNVLFKSKKIIFLNSIIYNYLTNVSTSIMSSTKIKEMINSFTYFEKLKTICPYKGIGRFIAPRWLLGTLHTVSKRNDFDGFKKIFAACKGRKHINKLIIFRDYKIVFLAFCNMFFGKKALYSFLRSH